MLFISLLFSINAAFAEFNYSGITTVAGEAQNCFSDTDGIREWRYCITETTGSRSADVLYEFHGLGGSESDWLNKDRNIKIRSYWKKNKIDAPTVVSISLGTVWILAEQNPSEFSGLYELVTQTIFTRVESKLKSYPGRRILMGASMGGFNATQIYLKNSELFDKYILACPIMAEISLYSSNAEIQKYQRETNASWVKVGTMFGIGRRYFPDEPSWETAWAIKLVPKFVSDRSPPVHVSCGQMDEYGVHNSAKKFADLVKENKGPVIWESLMGGHCTTNPNSIAKFIAE